MIRRLSLFLLLALFSGCGTTSKAPLDLKVSENGRFLVRADGKPFFYLGDTAWELFHRLDREEADLYLKNRAEKRFTVIQAVVLAEWDGLTEPNRYGHLPLIDGDPSKPNEPYFKHVDYVVNRAASLGLVVGMLPTWGDKVNKRWGKGPEIFTPENAESFGRFLGKRYRNKPIIWILGGDRPVESEKQLAIWRAMANGLRAGDGGRHLITYHTMGGHSSSRDVHDEPWLDFNTFQSGHSERDIDADEMAAKDWARAPAKPTLDAEPCYEDHPVNWKPENGWFDEYDVRKAVYRSLFAGGAGVTYGCHDVWQFFDPARHPPVSSARTHWKQALDLPAAGQMKFARELLESRPYLTRIPDPSIVVSDRGTGADRIVATRNTDGAYALVYLPTSKPVVIDLTQISGPVRASWFDPRTGVYRPVGIVPNKGRMRFEPPAGKSAKIDWVLVLESTR